MAVAQKWQEIVMPRRLAVITVVLRRNIYQQFNAANTNNIQGQSASHAWTEA